MRMTCRCTWSSLSNYCTIGMMVYWIVLMCDSHRSSHICFVSFIMIWDLPFYLPSILSRNLYRVCTTGLLCIKMVATTCGTTLTQSCSILKGMILYLNSVRDSQSWLQGTIISRSCTRRGLCWRTVWYVELWLMQWTHEVVCISIF